MWRVRNTAPNHEAVAKVRRSAPEGSAMETSAVGSHTYNLFHGSSAIQGAGADAPEAEVYREALCLPVVNYSATDGSSAKDLLSASSERG